MKHANRNAIAFVLKALVAAYTVVAGEPGAAKSEPRFTSEQLRADAEVAFDALQTLHPGLHRYLTPTEFDRNYQRLRREFASELSLRDAYLAMARFTATIRCGHTWLNPLNQPDQLTRELSNSDKLPLHFAVLNRRFLVTRTLTETNVPRGAEITAVDGVSVPEVIRRLWPYLRADGASDAKRLAQIGHDAGASAFDQFYGLLAPASGNTRTLQLRFPDGTKHQARVALASETSRERNLAAQPGAPTREWTYREDGDVGIIVMPTWAFWNVKFDWSSWLDHVFDDIAAHQIRFLVVDLRANEGGDGAIGDELIRRIAKGPSGYPSYLPKLAYDVVPDRLRPVLNTWDRTFYDQRSRVEPLSPGVFTLREREPEYVEIQPLTTGFRGKTYVLIGPNDSSATFEFARVVHDAHLATLVGQPTGGNLRGINGGNMFFLRLPNTGITIDLPLIAWTSRNQQPDGPVAPDIIVPPDFARAAQGADPEMSAVRSEIARTN